jgi:hypothetical protein
VHVPVNARAAAYEGGKRWGRKVGEADSWDRAVSERERKEKEEWFGGLQLRLARWVSWAAGFEVKVGFDPG